MLTRLTSAVLITPPAIWGKLPAHGDYVRSGMRHGESEGWHPWLVEQATEAVADANPRGAVPAAFVLPPGVLACARRRYVVGVITPSIDRVGRRHALLVYQMARPRWVLRHFAGHAAQPRDWLYWLARLVATQVQVNADVGSLERAVGALWRVHAPPWTDWVGRVDATRDRTLRSQAVLDASGNTAVSIADAPSDLRGVRYLPWVDWPQRLTRGRGEGSFWQQDRDGGFINAGGSFRTMWESGQ